MRTIHREIVGGFIISGDHKILLGKTNAYEGHWVVPGGGIDEGETKIEALGREMLEETGVDINDAKVEEMKFDLTGSSEKTLRDTGERVLVEMVFYNFTITFDKPADQIKVRAADDFRDAKWFTPAELKELNLSPPTKTSLRKLAWL